MTEQNLRKRFTLRTERVDEPRYKTTRPMTLNRPRRTEPLNSHEPMEIDHYRDAKRCYSCGKVGHVSRSTKVTQLFYVVKDMNRNVILGKDWLVQNGVRLYFDLGCLRIQKNYVSLEEDIHVASIVRLTVNAVLKPQTINVCPVGLKNNPSFGSTKLLEISPVASGYVSTEPGLMISNTVVNFNKNRKFPLMIVNNTNKTVKLRRGCVVGKASHVGEINLVNVNQSQGTSGLEKLDESEISVPQEFKKDILRMIRDNEDIFATSDKDLGCTDTVQMTIDTGDHPPIKLKPYRAPLNQRKIIDKAIEELLEANIIRKSRSAWAAPIIIVSKKDKTSRMCVDYRSLNAANKIYSFPLPLIDDLLASVGKAKGELVKVPLLAYPDLNKPYVLYTDASDNCVGACLTQVQESPIKGENEVERPIYFLSHKLSDTQTRWSTIEKEAFAIHYALQKIESLFV
ncbi:unnamed protein product [Mytilus coruscus]|uniref:Reverse transcriptase/retrotransposon-derived protein RNase H-like domain-containing protein n=1 Tax=Mytilus coruscus TaxID=42192 RepID=A0A6J8E9B8_MYTCO|nr:unnamed protein product [Mytilus coruscus]